MRYFIVLMTVAAMTACSAPQPEENQLSNPLLVDSTLPYGLPPFDQIENEHFAPAFDAAMAEHLGEIDAIANNPEPASFENVFVELEKAGQRLSYVARIFYNLSGTYTNESLQAIQREYAPKLSAHSDAILLNPQLFARVQAVYEDRNNLGLDAESVRLVEEGHKDFIRAGARLSESDKERLKAINGELAQLGTQFSQKVLAEVNDSAVVFDDVSMLDGMSAARIEAAAAEAQARGLDEGQYVVTLLNTSGQPPLAYLSNREARERIHKASLKRGTRGNEYDTREIVTHILTLRNERAQMLGYDSHADYTLEVQTAGSVDRINDLHAQVGPIAVANARKEGEVLQAMIDESYDQPFDLASWDWAFFTEKVRQARYDFDDSEVRPYFEMNNVLVNGVFYSAEKLFGITFKERTDLPKYHPDTNIWEVFDADGSPLGLFITDFYARSSKRGGAWMNSYQIYSGLLGGAPVVANHLNVTKPPEGEPTLLTWDEVTTMFHEFGHAVHGMLTSVYYPSFSGTSVPRDFVEYPSQVYEMWADWPEVLQNYAIHYETGEPIPSELLSRVMEAALFNEGFRTTEYLAASILDFELHQLDADEIPGPDQLGDFEAQTLAKYGMEYKAVPPRYRPAYFSHSMGGYSAGYYSYFWAEVLDADSVLWIRENGGLDRATGDHLRNTILSQGGSQDAMALYEQFAGRIPGIEPLLERRGLLQPEVE
jgi:peptidyl-dipeptidase Dcp